MTGKPPIADLDPAFIGELLIRYVAVANALGHKRLSGTLKDYVDDSDASAEARFLRAAVTRPVEEVIAEWYGDRSVADAIVQGVALD